MEVPPGVSLRSLVAGFVLTKRTEGKSPRTVEYYQDNLRRFLWYAQRQGWSDDVRFLTEWQIREFLGYCGLILHEAMLLMLRVYRNETDNQGAYQHIYETPL